MDNGQSKLRSLEQLWDTVSTLLARDLRVRYKGSTIGFLWAILSPIGTVAILHFVFTRILPLTVPNYALFLYLGLWPWTWLQSSIDTGSSTLLDNRDLVRTPFFRHAILPVIATGTNFILFLLAVPVLVGFMRLEGVAPSPLLLVLPLVWVAQGLFILACTVIFAALSVIVRDVKHLLGVVMMMWFYCTPIFYDVGRIPGNLAWWLSANPMTAFVDAHRAIVLNQQMPNWPVIGAWALGSSVVLWAGVSLYHVLQDQFIEA
jgi:ABC-2 type transport system permease protein